MISAANDGIFGRLCDALGIAELAADPRFLTNPLRVEHREALVGTLAPMISQYETSQLWTLLSTHNVPCAPIHDAEQVVRDEQVLASGMIPESPHPEIEGYRDLSLPLQMEGERPRAKGVPPAVGAHTDEVLRELGLLG
jgi:glutaryl-CoA transferase